MKKPDNMKSDLKEIKKDLNKKRTPKSSRYHGYYIKDTRKEPKSVIIEKIKDTTFFISPKERYSTTLAPKWGIESCINDFLTAKKEQPLQKEFFMALRGKKKDSLTLALLCAHIAHGNQKSAETLVIKYPELALLTGMVTDYSGRTFNCTAYEYAYWAKDTHMCRMLEQHMDEYTKSAMLEKIIAIDTVGLTYEQHGKKIEHSKHFDMTPLITELQNYVNEIDAWFDAGNYNRNKGRIKVAWLLVGWAQRDLPVHVINEYCRPDRSFDPLPAFKENNLPRVLTYHNYLTEMDKTLFPLVVSNVSGLADDLSLGRGRRLRAGLLPGLGSRGFRRAVQIDLMAVSHLDEVRTVDLTRSRENLLPVEHEHGLGMNS